MSSNEVKEDLLEIPAVEPLSGDAVSVGVVGVDSSSIGERLRVIWGDFWSPLSIYSLF